MTKLSEMIEHLYFIRSQSQDLEDEEARTITKFTAQANIYDLAMLDAVASFFGQSRASFTIELIHEAALELFHSLTPIDQLAVASLADKTIADHHEKVGYSFFSEEFKQVLVTHWSRQLPKQPEGAE